MAHWAVVVPAERYAAERLFLHDMLELTGLDGPVPAVGDEVALVAGGSEPVVFGLGRVAARTDGAGGSDDAGPDETEDLDIAYTHRLFDAPLPADGLGGSAPGAYPLDAAAYAALRDKAGDAGARSEWLVGVYLPIEAASRAEAVRAFWTYVLQLGPRELPAFVSPLGDELAMQAFVLGDVANLDPEEDEEGD